MCLLTVWWESKESQAEQEQSCLSWLSCVFGKIELIWNEQEGCFALWMVKFFPFLRLLLYRYMWSFWWSECSAARTVQGHGDLPFTLPLSLLVFCWWQSRIFFLNRVLNQRRISLCYWNLLICPWNGKIPGKCFRAEQCIAVGCTW